MRAYIMNCGGLTELAGRRLHLYLAFIVCLFRWPPESTNGRAQTYSGITGIQIKPNHLAVNSPIPVVTGKGEKTVAGGKKAPKLPFLPDFALH